MLTRLKLRDFRCFSAIELPLAPGAQYIVGGNAQGKTSLLEAAAVLLRLASPRASSLAGLVRFGAPEFSIRGKYNGMELQVRFGPEGRALSIDDQPQSGAAEYLRTGRVVYFGNVDAELVRGAGEGRRRFLDFAGAQIEPMYRANLRAYERALRSRNRLLKAFPMQRREVDAYDAPLLEAGAILTDLRRNLVHELAPWAAQAHASIRGVSEGETLSIEYVPGAGMDFAAQLAASREEESRLRQTMVGPHRDELRLQLDGRPASAFGSEGQQRTLALALKLAQARLIEQVCRIPPLLLLDDIFGELDVNRRNALLAALPDASQRLIATTHLDWWEQPREGPVWRLENARLREDS